MTGAIKGYRIYLAGLVSKATIDQYAGCIVRAEREYDDLLDVLSDESLTKGRRRTYRKALLHYARFREDLELETRLRELTLPGRGSKRSHPKVVPSTAEWERVRKAVLRLDDVDLRATLYLLATLGLRIERELLALTGQHFSNALETGSALIEQKGGTWRYLVISTDRQKAVARHLCEQLREDQPLWSLFQTKQRRRQKSVTEYIRRSLAKIGDQLGLKLTPHALRHAFLDAVYDKTDGNLELVREAAGHASVTTTRNYYQDRGHPITLNRLVKESVGED